MSYQPPPPSGNNDPYGGAPYGGDQYSSDPYGNVPPPPPGSVPMPPPMPGADPGPYASQPPAPGYGSPAGSYGDYGGYGGYMGMGSEQENSKGLWAMILGIASIPLSFCFIGFFCGIAGIIVGVMGRKAVTEGRANNGGMALTGIICGGAGVLFSVVWFVINMFAFAVNGS